LETALLKTPQVVVFKASLPSFVVGSLLVGLEFFSLVNLILNRQAVLEILQFQLATKIRIEIDKILSDSDYRNHIVNDYNTIENMLGEQGVSDRVAAKMIELLIH